MARLISLLPLCLVSILQQSCSKDNSPKNYIELTKQPYFIDHTKLLSEFSNRPLISDPFHFAKPSQPTITFFSCPRGFGKTTNLQMMQLYNDLELDPDHKPKPLNETLAYEIFSKLSIGREKFFPWNSKKYDSFKRWIRDNAQRPVISLDLETTEILANFDEEKIVAFLNEKLYQAFEKYKWILDLPAETLQNINLLNLHQKVYNGYLKNIRVLEVQRDILYEKNNFEAFMINERLHKAFVEEQRISDVPNRTLFGIDQVKPYLLRDEHVELIRKLGQKKLSNKFEIGEAFYRFVQFIQTYFQSAVLVLIDDYDSAFVRSSKPSKQQIEFFYQFVNDVIKHIAQPPHKVVNRYIWISSTTGLLYPLIDRDEENWYRTISCLDDEEVRNYYGFSETDVGDLAKRYELTTKQIEEIKQHYGGYTQNFTTSYNPAWVIQYLKNLETEKDKALKFYWNLTKNDDYLRGFRDDQVFRDIVRNIVNGGIAQNDLIRENNISDTKQFFHLNDQNQYKNTDYSTLIRYVYEHGYVTNTIDNGTVGYKAANAETKRALKTLILE